MGGKQAEILETLVGKELAGMSTENQLNKELLLGVHLQSEIRPEGEESDAAMQERSKETKSNKKGNE